MKIDSKIQKIVLDTYNFQQEVDALQNKISENKKLIQEYFENDNIIDKNIVVSGIKCSQIDSAYITYNGVKLEEKLRKNDKKELIDYMIKKAYYIIDIKAFMKLMKLTELSPYTVKSHIKVERNVDGQAVKRMFERGEIDKDILDGTFESKIVKSIRFNKIKTPEGD